MLSFLDAGWTSLQAPCVAVCLPPSQHLEPDDGWDKYLVPGGKTKRFRVLDKELLEKGLLTYYSRNTYVFLTASNTWATFVSAEAQSQIYSIVGSENVSVSYLPALEPFIDYLEEHANRVSAVSTLVCIGTRHKMISVSEEGLELRDPNPITPIQPGMDSRVTTFCLMPCAFKETPTRH